MAVAFVKHLGSAQNKAGSTSIAVTLTETVAVGNSVFVRLAGDGGLAQDLWNVSDTRGNTYTNDNGVVAGGSDSSGVVVVLFQSAVTTALQVGDVITFDWGPTSVAAKAFAVDEFSGASGTKWVAVGNSTGATLTVSATPSAAVLIALIGVEGPISDTFTEDADSVDGVWVSLTRVGTSGGGAASNITLNSAYKIVNTPVDTQNYNPTVGGSDQARVLVNYLATTAPDPGLRFRSRRTLQAVNRSSVI